MNFFYTIYFPTLCTILQIQMKRYEEGNRPTLWNVHDGDSASGDDVRQKILPHFVPGEPVEDGEE